LRLEGETKVGKKTEVCSKGNRQECSVISGTIITRSDAKEKDCYVDFVERLAYKWNDRRM
jgi:hypothetical protein